MHSSILVLQLSPGALRRRMIGYPASLSERHLPGSKWMQTECVPMRLFHNSVDLPRDLCSEVCFAAPVTDVCRDIPDDDDFVMNPPMNSVVPS